MIRQFMLGYAGVLYFYPPDGPSDGDVELTLTSASGSAWGDTPSPITLTPDAATEATTVEAAEGADALTVASTSGFTVGKRYLIVLDDGYWFEVVLRAKSSTVLTIDDCLPVTIPAGSTIRGFGVSHEITADELASVERGNKAVFVYEVGGESVQFVERFDVVREPFRLAITLRHLREQAADFSDFSGATKRWRSYIDGAHSDVDEIIRGMGIYPDRILNREALRSAMVCNILMKLHALTQNPLTEYYRNLMNEKISIAIKSLGGYDANDNGVDDDIYTSPPAASIGRII